MRLFLSIEPDDIARRALRRVQRRLLESELGPSLRMTPPEQLHLTLKFIGEWEEPRLPELVDALRTVRFTPLRAVLAAIEAIPSCHKPRVLAVSVEPRDELTSLSSRIDEALCLRGVPREDRAFRPHLTVARLRAGRRVASRQVQSLVERSERIDVAFPVNSLSLVQSRLSSEGAVHTRLWHWDAP